MKAWIQRKRKASGAFGYVFLFLTAMILVILSLYLTSVAKLMTHQHHVDDALADSVLASLVADDVYYFETMEESGVPVLRFQNTDESHRIFKDCMEDAIRNTDEFYYNFRYDDFICYEVEDNVVTVTKWSGESEGKSVSTKEIGSVYAPTGELVTKTSAYGRVRFDIKSMIDGSMITKTKDIYCTLEISN